MFKDEDTPMSSEPENDLEALFAAEEAAIKDDGFTARVVAEARTVNRWRRPAIYGAGLVGAGFALGGVSELAPHLRLLEWVEEARTSLNASVGDVTAAGLSQASQGVPDALLIGAAAVIAGVSCLLAALTMQTR